VNPLAVANPLNQSGLAEDPQVAANARLTLTHRLREIGNAQITLIAQGEQAKPAGLACCPQPRNQFRCLSCHN
jgi:hypothetical protein